MMYLLTWRAADGTFSASIFTMSALAKLIGFSDCTDDHDFRAWRLIPGSDPQPLFIEHWHNYIYLFDRYDNEVDHAEYNEH